MEGFVDEQAYTEQQSLTIGYLRDALIRIDNGEMSGDEIRVLNSLYANRGPDVNYTLAGLYSLPNATVSLMVAQGDRAIRRLTLAHDVGVAAFSSKGS